MILNYILFWLRYTLYNHIYKPTYFNTTSNCQHNVKSEECKKQHLAYLINESCGKYDEYHYSMP